MVLAVATGVAAVMRPFDVHFETFVRAPKIYVKGGMAVASPAAFDRVGLVVKRAPKDLQSPQGVLILSLCRVQRPRGLDYVYARFQQDVNLD